MTRRVATLFLAARIFAGAEIGGAETPPFETPASNDVYLFEPYGWQMEFSGSVEPTACGQGFDVTVFRDGFRSCEPRCTLEDFGLALSSGAGVLFVGTHGSVGYFTIEMYEKTDDGLAARDRAFNDYMAADWPEGYIVATADSYGYGIAITGFGIMSRFNDRNSIVYVASCHSCTVVYGFEGAREILCYDGAESVVQVLEDAGLFWSAMNGDICRACRAVAIAAGPLYTTLRHYHGTGATVLSPAVCAMSLEEDGLLETLMEEWVAFDTRMDTSSDPVLTVQGPAMAGDLRWINDTCFVFEAAPYDTDLCSICVSPNLVSAGGRGLDGNMNPPNSVAKGPSGDPHCITLYAQPEDPATRWGGLWAYKIPGGVRVEWTTETERNSDHFVVFGIRGNRREPLGRVEARGIPGRPTFYSMDLPAGHEPFVVSEVDAHGRFSNSRPFSPEAEPPAHLELARMRGTRDGEEYRVNLAVDCPCAGDPVRAGFTPESWPHTVFYGPDSLLAEVSPVVDAWSAEGLRTHLEHSTAGDPCLLLGYLQGLKAEADGLGLPCPTVIVVGDANEGGEPEKNVVGTLYFPDSNGACYFSDYCSAEHDLADLDFDGLADLNLSRIPADRRAEVARSCETYLHWIRGSHPETALFLSGDLDEGDVTAGPLDRVLADVRAAYDGRGIATVLRRDSAYDWSDNWTRQYDVAGDLNAGVTEVFAMGAISNRLRTPGMFIQKVVSPRWDMDWLTEGPSPFVFWGPGCGMADIDRDNPAADPVLAEMFLFNDPAAPAAVAWMSHGRGHWSTCHILFARELADWRFSGEVVDVLDCYTRAKNSCVTKYPQTRDYVRSLYFLGWPVALPGMGVAGVATPGAGPQFGPAKPVFECFPNPFNPSATVRYSLNGRMRALLEVFDVSGRRVIRLVDQVQAPGVHEIVWNGLDVRGLDVSSGVYFVRMVADEKASTAKIVMAR